MGKVAPNNILLELHVPDFQMVKEFYGKLGFEVVWEREPEAKKGYLVMRRDDNILCFFAGNRHVYEQSYFKRFPRDTKRGYAVEIVIIVGDVQGVYKKAKKLGSVVDDLKLQPWGLKDFRAEDPFGFYLRFTEPHNILDEKNAVQ